jgi:hypothetical protein
MVESVSDAAERTPLLTYMPRGPTRLGRPWSWLGSEGQVGFGEFRGVPDDAGAVAVPVFNVADGVALVSRAALMSWAWRSVGTLPLPRCTESRPGR